MTTRRPRTSCEPCRTARIGCDAASKRPSSCSNCVRRGKLCNTQPRPASSRAQRRPPSDLASESHEGPLDHGFASPTASQMPITPSSSSFGLEGLANRRLQANLMSGLLWEVYASVFEVRFAIWLGDSCCPYLELTPKPKASITRLILQIDAYEAHHRPTSNVYQGDLSASLSQPPAGSQQRLLNDALRNAIYAYSIRWLPLRSAYEEVGSHQEASIAREQAVRDQLWYWAKQSIMHVLTRPSYRSILTLLLFTLTEPPKDLDDPGFLRLCNQALFGHLHDLRSPMRWRVDPSATTLLQGVSLPAAQEYNLLNGQRTPFSGQHKHSRDQIFWLFVVCACSRGLIQQLPTSALSRGLGDRELWDYIRQRTMIFDQSFRVLRNSASPLPQDVAEVVLQHASACKTMYLALINQLSFSLIQEDSSDTESTAQNLSEESHRFHEVFDHLLAMCTRDYIMLSPQCQLNHLLLVSHYNLGSLILADTLDTAESAPESLRDPAFSRLHACQAIVNALSLSLNCDRYSSHDSSPSYGHMLLMDPSPELMVEVLLRTGNALLLLHRDKELTGHATQAMLSVVISALDILSRVSRNAGLARALFRAATKARQLRVIDRQERQSPKISSVSFATLAASNTETVEDFMQEMDIQASMNPEYLDDIVKGLERKLADDARS